MGLIAFNRYIRVVKPELYSRLFPSKRVARLYCALVWIASLLLATPPLYGWGKIVYHPLFTACCFDWKLENISYAIVIVSVVFNGTTVSIFYFYYKIYMTLKESTQNLNTHSMEDRLASSGRPETDIRLLKTSFTVVCVFLMTWGPITFVVVLETAGCSIPREIFIISMYLMFTSSLVNPLIQVFRERLSEKVHATTPKGIVGSFECPVLQRNLKELHGRPRTYVCECQRKVKKLVLTATVVRNSVLIISHITFRDCRVHIFSDNLSRNSCIRDYESAF